MAVIVHDEMPIELALRMLWRESKRELIPDTLKNNRYYVKPTTKVHDKKKIYEKQKRRRSAQTRRYKQRGWLVV
jgi:ribosomal protein S21